MPLGLMTQRFLSVWHVRFYDPKGGRVLMNG